MDRIKPRMETVNTLLEHVTLDQDFYTNIEEHSFEYHILYHQLPTYAVK